MLTVNSDLEEQGILNFLFWVLALRHVEIFNFLAIKKILNLKKMILLGLLPNTRIYLYNIYMYKRSLQFSMTYWFDTAHRI